MAVAESTIKSITCRNEGEFTVKNLGQNTELLETCRKLLKNKFFIQERNDTGINGSKQKIFTVSDNTLKALKEQHHLDDIQMCRNYVFKADYSEERGIDFELSYNDYKRLKNTKRCYFTGAILTSDNFSLDRIDSSLGYTKENTVACTIAFNSFKSTIENPTIDMDFETALKGMLIWKKSLDKNKKES